MPFNVEQLRESYLKYDNEIRNERLIYEEEVRLSELNNENIQKKKKKSAISFKHENTVQLDQLIRILQYLNLHRDRLAAIVQGKYLINTFFFDHGGDVLLSYSDLDQFLEPLLELTLMPRDAILLLLKSYRDDRIKPADYESVPTKISLPPKFEFGSVQWYPGADRAIGAYRYINNFDVGDAITKIDIEIDASKRGNYINTRVREAKLYKYYIDTVLNQTRSVNFSKCVLAMLIVAITDDSEKINPGVHYLQKLFEPFVRWPFLDTNMGMRWIITNGVSSQIPLLGYSILNRMISWDTGVINDQEFHLCMSTYFEWSLTSFDDEHLAQKSKMNKVRKLLNELVQDENVLRFDSIGISGTVDVKKKPEFWLEGEKEELLSILRDTQTTRKYFDFVSSLLGKSFKRDEIIRLKMALACVSNPSTYKKSSPILEYDRSAEGRPKGAIFTKPVEFVDDFAIGFEYNGVLDRMWHKLMSKMNSIKEGMKKRNLADEYYDRLTNNSAGMTQQRINAKRSSNPLLKAFNDIPYGSRYVSALIDNEVLFNKTELLASLSTPVKAGKREQIDRRSRWIMMVMNSLQVVFSAALSFSREFQKTNDYIASGKQVGDVRDMIQSLRASSNPFSLITDNDIVGMDSSTQEQISNFILYGLFHSLDGMTIDEFFYASSTEKTVVTYNDDGTITRRSKRFNAAQVYLIDVISHMRTNPFEFTEGIINDTVKLPAAAFWSGAFHTAGQHNTILGLVLELVNDEYVSLKREVFMRIHGAILGDDLSIEVSFNNMNDKTEDLMRGFITRLRADLYEIGFEAEPESSRYEATFLQQSTFMGAVVPKHARISVFCAENGVGRARNPFDQISELGDILDELSARTFKPERCNVILSALWMTNRAIRLSKFLTTESALKNRFNVLKSHDSLYKKWVTARHDGVVIKIPYYAILMPEINGINFPLFQDIDGDFFEPSFFTPRGTITEWFMMKISYFYYDKTKGTLKHYVEKGVNRYKGSLSDKLNKGLIDEVTYEQRLKRNYGLSMIDLISHDLLFEIGFGFSQWLFELFGGLIKLSTEKKNDNALQMLISIGKQKLNPKRASDAEIAGTRLRSNGVVPSPGLAYFNQPRTRIIQAIEASKQDVKMNLNESIVDKLVSLINGNKPVHYKFKDVGILNFSITVTDEPIEPCSIAPFLRVSSLCPCIRNDTNEWKLQQLFGVPFDNPSIDKLTEFFKINLPVGSDPEKIFDEALRINTKDPRLITNFLLYIGLPEILHTQAILMINEYNRVGVIGYQSIKSTRKFFFIGTSIFEWPRFVIQRTFPTEPRKWNVLFRSLARDYLLAFPYVNNKVNVAITRELALRLVSEN